MIAEDIKFKNIYDKLRYFRINYSHTVKKSGLNSFFKTSQNPKGSEYSTYEDCLKVLKELHGLDLYLDQRNVIDKDFPDQCFVLTVVVDIKTGEKTEPCITPLFFNKNAQNPMQEYGKANTYACRYALVRLFAIGDIDFDAQDMNFKNSSSEMDSTSAQFQNKKENGGGSGGADLPPLNVDNWQSQLNTIYMQIINDDDRDAVVIKKKAHEIWQFIHKNKVEYEEVDGNKYTVDPKSENKYLKWKKTSQLKNSVLQKFRKTKEI